MTDTPNTTDEAPPRWQAPKKLTEIVAIALERGRSYSVIHGTDTGDNPFVALTVGWDGHEVRMTWHTRSTGTYRLFSAIVRTPTRDWHDVTATAAAELIGGES